MTTISEKPWSDYTAADYSLEQWHKACLIHLHDGDPTSKSQCKLPVRTPQGALNRNGVHAAASVLAGGRGGVNAPAEKIAAAKRAIVSLYGQLGEEPPDSMKQSDEDGVTFDLNDVMNYALEHHGVKGQKWGVRNDKGHQGEQAKTKKIAKLDKKFEAKASSLSVTIDLHNRAAELANSIDVPRINKKYEGNDFHRDSPIRRKYYKEQQDAFLNRLDQAAKEMGTNASGTKEYRITETNDGWDVYVADVQHAAQSPLFHVNLSYDANGYIVEIGSSQMGQMMQTDIDELLDYVIEHHGIKGQKWGVRRTRRQLDGASQHLSVNRHPDAQRAHDIATQQKTQGTHSLSNQDLQTLITRMNLEQQFNRLSTTHQNAGKKFIKDLLVGVGKEHAKNIATKATTQAGKKILAKAVAKKAARAAVKVATGV